ncbi:hypothetical protein JKP88DRAFT_144012, partial [Tribonema minus]
VPQVIDDAPWVVTDEFYFESGNASGVNDDGDVYAHLNRAGRFVETCRTEGISTSDSIASIMQPSHNYNAFVRRNLRRGYSAKDMNVSFLEQQAIKFGMVKERVAENTIGKLIKENSQAQALAEDVQKAFVSVFDRDSAFRTRWRNQRKEIRNRIRVLAR